MQLLIAFWVTSNFVDTVNAAVNKTEKKSVLCGIYIFVRRTRAIKINILGVRKGEGG
jgi:hypothetical protein